MKVFAMLAMLATAGVAAAEPVVTIRNNGPQDNRIGVAIVGDGYTQAELLKYTNDVEMLVQAYFDQAPYFSYASYFNVYRVDVVSNESGADHPERGVMRDTALGANYNCGNIQRLICVDIGAVNAVLSRSLPINARDIVIVLVNDTEYGGSGGSFTVASTHRDSAELALHEGGHSFGLLTDEYDTSPPTCNNTFEPPEANAAREIGRQQIKWSRWVDASTPLPTTGGVNGVVGAFEGARYCPTGLYRPTFNSKMRSLNRPFEQVNSEQLIRRIYNFVAPIDAAFPPETTITAPTGSVVELSVVTTQPASHNLNVRWLVDNAVAGQDRVLRINTALLAPGSHSVVAEVSDPTAAVRHDPNGVLTDRRTWTLTVQGTLDDLRKALEEMIGRWRKPF